MKHKTLVVLISIGLWDKLQQLKKDGHYNTITHIVIEALKDFLESKGY